MRCLGETEIIFAYLVEKGTEEEFNKFREYSKGKEKLLMLHLQDNLQKQATIEGKTIQGVADDLGGGFIAEITDIDLKGWTKKDTRQMAQEVGLEEVYRWVIDPSSSELHGSWTSIRKSNLVVCSQILHRFHMVPKFYEPPVYLSSLFIATECYLRCQEFAIRKLNFPKPDQDLQPIPTIEDAYNRRIQSFKEKPDGD